MGDADRRYAQCDGRACRKMRGEDMESVRRRIRNLLIVALVIIGVVLVSAARWVPLRNQRTCVNQMNQWYSAAVQSCLEKNVKADRLFTIEELSPLVGSSAATCPTSKRPYPPFTI